MIITYCPFFGAPEELACMKSEKMEFLCAVPISVWAEAQQQVCVSANRRSQQLLEERSFSGYEEICLESS